MSDNQISNPAGHRLPVAHAALRRAAFASTDGPVRWTLRREGESARCIIRPMGDRVELHITMSHDVVMTQQCSAPEQADLVSRTWWSALIDRGWVDDGSGVTLRPKGDRRLHKTGSDSSTESTA